MTEQLLQRPQVRSPRQQMSRETVPEGVRRQRVRQAEPPARRRHGPAHEIRVERPPRAPTNSGTSPRSEYGHCRTYSSIASRTAGTTGPRASSTACRSLETSARSARWRRSATAPRRREGPRRKAAGGWQGRARRSRARSRLRPHSRRGPSPRRARRGAEAFAAFSARAFAAAAHDGPGARRRNPGRRAPPRVRALRRTRRAPSPPVGEKGAQVRCAQVEQAVRRNLLAAIATEEMDQAMCRRDIGAHGMRRTAAVMLEVRRPLRRKRLGGMNQPCGFVSHLRIIAASELPRNISSSEPCPPSRLRSARWPSASNPAG